jgi:outer membrane autotransporter protein
MIHPSPRRIAALRRLVGFASSASRRVSPGFAAGAVAALLLPAAASAAPIVWSGPQNITTDSDVFQGRLVTGAYQIGGPGVTGATVNGTTFAPFLFPFFTSATATTGNFTFSTATPLLGFNNLASVPFPPFSNLSPAYQKILSSIAGIGRPETVTLTMRQLTVGRIYTFQAWTNLSFAGASTFPVTANGVNPVTINPNPSNRTGGVGQFATGTFVADSPTQLITFLGSRQTFFSAFQLVEGGHATYHGNFSQSGSSLLSLVFASPTNFDSLHVFGTAHLGGRLNLALTNDFVPRLGETFTAIESTGGLSGRFSMVDASVVDNITLRPFYGKDDLTIRAVVASFAAVPGITANEQAVGRNLDTVLYDPRAGNLLNFLYNRNLNELPKDLARISPDGLTSIFTMGIALEQQQSLNLQRRTEDIRSGSSGFSAANLAINGANPFYSGAFNIDSANGTNGINSANRTNGTAGPNGFDGKAMKETREIAPAENRWGAFLSGTGEWVNVDGTDNARGYDLATGGFTLGVDYKLCPHCAIGLAAGYTGTTTDLADHGRIYMNGGRLGIYATTFSGGWYADVAGFGGYDSYDARRGGLQGQTRGDTDGGEIDALFGTGYDFKVGALTFGPTASFNYTYVGFKGYTETGSLAPLNIHGDNENSYRSAFGFKVSYECKCGHYILRPELRAAWQHEYGQTAYALDSSFANGAGSTFTVNGPALGRDSCLLGAGFALQLNDRTTIYTYYDGELGRRNYLSNAVTGGIRVAF